MIETYVSIGKVIDYAIGVLKYFATASSILLISIIGALTAWIFWSAVGMIVAIVGIVIAMTGLSIPTLGEICGWADKWDRDHIEADGDEQLPLMKQRRNRVAYYKKVTSKSETNEHKEKAS